MKTEYTQFLQ